MLQEINEQKILNNQTIKPKYKNMFERNLEIMIDTNQRLKKWIRIIRQNINHFEGEEVERSEERKSLVEQIGTPINDNEITHFYEDKESLFKEMK